MKKKDINLRERKEGYMRQFRGGKGRGKLCNYIIISKRKENKFFKKRREYVITSQ